MFEKNIKRSSALVVVLTAVLLFSTPIWSAAQRTMEDQSAVGVELSANIQHLGDLGVCLNYSQYLLEAYWQVNVWAGNNHIAASNGYNMQYVDCCLGGEYMYRLVSTRSRSISLYAGGGAFLGYDFYDPRKELPATIDTKLPKGNFLYGISPHIEAEFFVTRQLALILGGVVLVNFTSPLVMFRPRLKMGLRVDI